MLKNFHGVVVSGYLLLGLLTGIINGQTVHINEIMSSNDRFLADDDGDFPDWLELYNSGDVSVDLAGWGLSDKINNPFKWIFPPVSLPPRSWMVVYASSKDRTRIVTHWETVIRRGMLWRYRPGASTIPASWIQPAYDDAGWNRGSSGIGFGDNDDATVISSTISVYGRITFTVADSAAVVAMLLDIDFDDGFVAYLNGTEIARANLGQTGVQPAWNLGASDREATMYRGLPPARFNIANFRTLLRTGVNLLAVQVHNSSTASSDLSMIPYLSLGYMVAPPNPSGPAAELKLKPSQLHTNFAISASGETLTLTRADGMLADSVTIPSSAANIAYARRPDGGARWLFVNQPTPEAANFSGGFLEDAAAVAVSHPSGFYSQPLAVTMSCATPGAQIRYTRDGAEPSSNSLLYSGPLGVGKTTVLRARAFASGMNPGPISTHNFILTPPPQPLPVIALTTDPFNLWDTEYGIYVFGTSYQSADPHYGANFWEDWERPVHIEFCEPGATRGFRQDAGMKIFGGWSRDRPQKSLAFFARGNYGDGDFNYALFPKLPYSSYHSFILRNGANDWDRTFFADGLIHTLVDGIDLEHQAYRPCTVYLNGEYWGLLNMREKINEYYLAQHHGGDPKKIDLLEMNGTVLEGVNDHYVEMRDYIASKDMSVTAHYDEVKTRMDVENFITYQAVQIYVDNRDWPGNNIKFWRPQNPDGKWRWILYDTEWGFGINAYGAGGNANGYTYNTLAFATSPTQTANHHGNPPWSTLLLRRLLVNPQFKNTFINRFADLMNGNFKEARAVAKVDSLRDLLAADMVKHYEKWRQPVSWHPDRLWWGSMSEWYRYIDILRQFGLNRPGYMRAHLLQKFGLQSTCLLRLECVPAEAGEIIMNHFLPVTATPWSGHYFTGVPVTVTAKTRAGYRFAGWEGAVTANESTVTLPMTASTVLKARFEAGQTSPGQIVINEINYKSAAAADAEDWIELYNSGSGAVELCGWHLKDDDDSHDYIFPANTLLEADGYLVVSRDMTKFRSVFPQTPIRLLGNLPYGLSSNGDQVRLFDANLRLIDSVAFGVTAPWPPQANGQGPTLELRGPALDNTLPGSWVASTGYGTPGAQNSGYTAVNRHPDTEWPDSFTLAQNYPNPFNAETAISFFLPQPARVEINIFAISGRSVRSLHQGVLPAGQHALHWDGRDAEGVAVSSGIYLCRLCCDEGIRMRRMLLLR